MPHISYSAFKNWYKCPFYHKLVNIDKVTEFQGSIHTAFGSAVHSVNELLVSENVKPSELSMERSKIDSFFKEQFKKELKTIPEEAIRKLKSDSKTKALLKDMFVKGGDLSILSVKQLHKQFPGFKVCSVEEDLFEPIKNCHDLKYDFKGFIDLIFETPDGIRHVVDWKTSSWGWDARKKADKLITYQLTYYKHFYADKHNLATKDIQVHFGLIKRTAKKNQIEIFEVPCGEIKIKNALKVLHEAVYNIDRKNFIKNRLECAKCEFNQTKWCP